MANFKTQMVRDQDGGFGPSAQQPLNSPRGGRETNWVAATFTVPSGIVSADTVEIYRFAPNTRILMAMFRNASLAATFTAQFGLGYCAAIGGPMTVLSGSTFATAVALGSANTSFTTMWPNTAAFTPSGAGNRIWEFPGLASDQDSSLTSGIIPREWSLVMTGTTITTPTVGAVAHFLFLIQGN